MVLGKFYPPTNGHLFLIESALEQCENVTVFMCSLKRERISGALRFNWLYQHYFTNHNIRLEWVQDELPQTPEEHGDIDAFYKLWTSVVHDRADNLNVIFTSEKYGEEFAQYLGIQHVMVDLYRRTHQVSGTAVRNNPIENWEHIPDVVKPYFKKKIVIMGPESTGKSTLTKQLAEHFNGDLVGEFGRNYTDVNPATEMGVDGFEMIAKTHDRLIDFEVENGKHPLIFIDTDALTTKLFGEMYLGDNFKSEVIDNIIAKQQFDLVLLCDIDAPWVDDGTRDFPFKKDRERHLHKIATGLTSRGIPYKIIRGNYDGNTKVFGRNVTVNERFELAKSHVHKLLSE